jgi:methenyltetrahydrofolate cyclohydrolase
MMFINDTIRAYVDKASAGTPTPGGGSISALTGALGVSMGCMAANFTVGKKKFEKVEPQVRSLLAKMEKAREELLRLCEEDSRAYGKLSEAMALPRTTLAEQSHRDAAMQKAMTAAMEAPLRVARVCADTVEYAAELGDIANPNLISDVGVCAILAEAALRGARLNVEVNLLYLRDPTKVAEVRQELAILSSRSTADEQRVAEKVERALLPKG